MRPQSRLGKEEFPSYFLNQLLVLGLEDDEFEGSNRYQQNVLVQIADGLPQTLDRLASLEYVLLHFVLGSHGKEERVGFGRYLP